MRQVAVQHALFLQLEEPTWALGPTNPDWDPDSLNPLKGVI